MTRDYAHKAAAVFSHYTKAQPEEFSITENDMGEGYISYAAMVDEKLMVLTVHESGRYYLRDSVFGDFKDGATSKIMTVTDGNDFDKFTSEIDAGNEPIDNPQEAIDDPVAIPKPILLKIKDFFFKEEAAYEQPEFLEDTQQVDQPAIQLPKSEGIEPHPFNNPQYQNTDEPAKKKEPQVEADAIPEAKEKPEPIKIASTAPVKKESFTDFLQQKTAKIELGNNFRQNKGIDLKGLSDDGKAGLNHFAASFKENSGGDTIRITSGYRGTYRQAAAMKSNMDSQGSSWVTGLYRDQNQAWAIRKAYEKEGTVEAISDVLKEYADKGRALSRHTSGLSFDIGLDVDKKAFKQTIKETGFSYIKEKDHYHIDVPKGFAGRGNSTPSPSHNMMTSNEGNTIYDRVREEIKEKWGYDVGDLTKRGDNFFITDSNQKEAVASLTKGGGIFVTSDEGRLVRAGAEKNTTASVDSDEVIKAAQGLLDNGVSDIEKESSKQNTTELAANLKGKAALTEDERDNNEDKQAPNDIELAQIEASATDIQRG